MSVWIQGMGVLGGFGCGRQALAEAMERGRVEPGSLVVPTGQGPVEIAAHRADTAPLERFLPRRALRRVDTFGRMALLGGCLAMEDAGLAIGGQAGLGLVLASGLGATGATLSLLDSIFEAGDACASPIHFANSLHNSAAAHLAPLLGADGPCITLSQGRLSIVAALHTARLWIEEGRADQVLVGCVEELSEVMGYAWLKSHGSAAVPGEGAAFFLLGKSPEGALAELASVEMGWGDAGNPVEALASEALYGQGYAAVGLDIALGLLRLRQDGLPSLRVGIQEPEGGWGRVLLRPA
ncbi:MAG: Beta-ketoacyl synthase [Holophagaceae bacterium]|nr:Beta-ketoacyl synthase [Holophagaceae bacterium]